MKKILLSLSACIIAVTTNAQVAITNSALTYTQDFNSLDTNSSTPSSNLPAGWGIFETGSSLTTVDQMYLGSSGTTGTGDTYSYGSIGSTDRALGCIGSGTNVASFGVKFVNNTSSALKGFLISFRGEQWRLGQVGRGRLDSLLFYYSTNASSVSDLTGTWTEEPSLMLNSVDTMIGVVGAMDGNATGNYTTISGHDTTLSIPVGGTIILKWQGINMVGTDDALAIDDLNITFVKVTAPSSVAVLANEAPIALSVLGNATSDKMTIACTTSEEGQYQLNIYDITGRQLYTQSINAQTGNHNITVSDLGLQPGMYFVRLSNGTSVATAKAIIQ
ncbi:MAG: T9SS type A sorting domain-containing protein [Bacteroidota bacterium]